MIRPGFSQNISQDEVMSHAREDEYMNNERQLNYFDIDAFGR